MGKQLLVMKHLTEAYGVDLRGTEGYKSAYAAVNVDEAAFEEKFSLYRTVTRIPELEGYEWSVLMQFMMAKAKAYLRIKGASRRGIGLQRSLRQAVPHRGQGRHPCGGRSHRLRQRVARSVPEDPPRRAWRRRVE